MTRTGPQPAPPGELTPTESRLARRAAGGSTNQEIAGRLFMASRTVEWNLSKAYCKLAVRSRTELASRLTTQDQPRSRA